MQFFYQIQLSIIEINLSKLEKCEFYCTYYVKVELFVKRVNTSRLYCITEFELLQPLFCKQFLKVCDT